MTQTIQKFTLAAIGSATLALAGALPAIGIEFTFSGTTGSSDSHFFPEYQNATFVGSFNIPDDAENQFGEHVSDRGKYEAKDVVIYLVNGAFPHFGSLFTDGPLAGQRGAKFIADTQSKASVTLSSFILDFTDFAVDNISQDNPTRADFRLFFTDVVGNASRPPTQAPDSNTFVSDHSFSAFKQAESGAPDTTFSVASARVEAVPEPSTIAGIGAFSLFLLKRRVKKSS